MVLGQEKICNKIQDCNLDTFPRSLMLVGERGAGKHLLCDYICEHLNIEAIDITDKLTLETIDDIATKVTPYLYIIHINKVSVKEENLILKFLEEPLKNSYIVLLAETEIGVLQTILNRCQIWHLQHYRKDVLMKFMTSDDQRILTVAHTPGMVMKLCEHPFSQMYSLAKVLVEKAHLASVARTLDISNRLAFKDERDKYDVELFILILLNVLSDKDSTVPMQKLLDAYQLTSELSSCINIKGIDKRIMFENYLIKLRAILKGEMI